MGRRRRCLTVASLVVVTASCSSGGPQAVDPAASGTASASSSAGFPAVLSTTTADSGRALTATELAAELSVDDPAKPPGFRGLSVVVANGLGSFHVAVPRSYTVVWRVGTPPDELLAEAARRDRSWADRLRRGVTDARSSGPLRVIALDSAPSDQVVALFFTLTPAGEATGEALAQTMREAFSGSGHTVRAARGVRVNGASGAYAAFTTAAQQGGPGPRIAVQVRIPDPPNMLLWGLTCETPDTPQFRVAELCARIASTFRPLPRVTG